MVVVRRRATATEQQTPELPAPVAYLWAIWNELHAARGSGAFAPNPINWTEIEAFSRVTDEPLEPWEARAIRAVDDVYIAGLVGASEGGSSG